MNRRLIVRNSGIVRRVPGTLDSIPGSPGALAEIGTTGHYGFTGYPGEYLPSRVEGGHAGFSVYGDTRVRLHVNNSRAGFYAA